MTYGNDGSVLLKIYFEFAYFLCLSPFRFKLNSSNEFVIRSWLPQKLFCGLISTFCSLWVLSDIYSQSQTPFKGPRSAVNCFYIILDVLTAVLGLAYLYISLFFSKKFLKILNCVYKNEEDIINVSSFSKILSKWVVILICFVYTLFSLFSLLNYKVRPAYDVSIDESRFISKSIDLWWSQLVKAGYHIFFLGPNYEHSLSGFDYIFGAVAVMTILQRCALIYYANLLVLISVLTLWVKVRQLQKTIIASYTEDDFKRRIKKNSISQYAPCRNACHIDIQSLEPVITWNEIRKSYDLLKTLSALINECIGLPFFLLMIGTTLYLAICFDALLPKRGWTYPYSQTTLVFFLIACCAVIIIAVDIPQRMESLKVWLAKEENILNIPAPVLNMVINEIDTNAVCIKGLNIYPMTCKTLSSMAGLFVTYFVICLQN